MEHVQSLFDRMSESVPLRSIDYGVLVLAIKMASARTPTARIAASQGQQDFYPSQQDEAARLITLLKGNCIDASGKNGAFGSFSRQIAEHQLEGASLK